MGYIRDLERELREMLNGLPDEKVEAVLKFVKDKVYQSYKNGCGQNGQAEKPAKNG